MTADAPLLPEMIENLYRQDAQAAIDDFENSRAADYLKNPERIRTILNAHLTRPLASPPPPQRGEAAQMAIDALQDVIGLVNPCISHLNEFSKDRQIKDMCEKGIKEISALSPAQPDVDLEEIVGRAIVKEAWAIEGLPAKALTTGYKLLGRAAIEAMRGK